MPELPEVETVRRSLMGLVIGRKLKRIEVIRNDLRILIPDKILSLEGASFTGIERRAKYLIFRLDSDYVMVSHLGMSGLWLLKEYGAERNKHDHVIFHLDDKYELVFHDPRRFGLLDIVKDGDLKSYSRLSSMGVECDDRILMTPKYLHDKFAKCSKSIKAALLDQKIVCGLGNIYVCEALWHSCISPLRSASSLQYAECKKLVDSILSTIEKALRAGGSSLKDFFDVEGNPGKFQNSFNVYDQEDKPCPRNECGGCVARSVQQGRSSFYCPDCQL